MLDATRRVAGASSICCTAGESICDDARDEMRQAKRTTRSRRTRKLDDATRPVLEQLEGRRLLSTLPFHSPLDGPTPFCNEQVNLDGTTTYIADCHESPIHEDDVPDNCEITGPEGAPGGAAGGGGGAPGGTGQGGGDDPQGIPPWGPSYAPDPSSGAPVRYFDGLAIIGTNDVSTDASGQYWGHTRSWRGGTSVSHNGNGWYVMDLPRLEWHGVRFTVVTATGELVSAEGTVQAVDSGGNRRYFNYEFDGTDHIFSAFGYDTDTMTFESGGGGDELVLRDDRGGETRYHMLDFPDGSAEDPTSGQFIKYTGPGGTVVEATWDTTSGQEGELLQVDVKNPANDHLERFVYSYTTVNGSGSSSVRRLSSVQHRVATGTGSGFTTERSVTYSYYTGLESGSHGRLGDLKLAQVRDGGTSATVIDSKFYRYSNPEADVSLIKSVFEGESFDRMAAAYPSYESATDAQLMPFVDHYFEYEKWDSGSPYGLSDLYRVTLEVASGDGCSACSGGQGTYKFEYATNSNISTGLDYDTIERNTWRVKTTEYLPDTTDNDWSDNDRNIVYTNEVGQVLMEVYREYDNGQLVASFYTAFRYDDDGQLTATMQPSAVTGLDETEPDLIGFDSGTGTADEVSQTDGMVWLFDWYDGSGGSGDDNATESTAGGVIGYLAGVTISRGLDGNAGDDVPVVDLAYKRRTLVSGERSVYLASQTRYRDEAGTQPITTSFDFTWYSGTTQAKSMTQHLQEATTGQNGPGSSANEQITTWFDKQGREVWVRDEGGFLHFTGYDVVTGAVVLSVTDADPTTVDGIINNSTDDLDLDTAVTASALSVTRTASGTALQIEHRAQVDRLGRVVRSEDPNGNVTWIVYNDADYEQRVYPGWDEDAGMTTGPIQITRTERGGTPDGDGHGRVFTEVLTLSATPTTSGSAGSYVPTGAETISASDIESLTRSVTNDAGQVVAELAYFNVAPLTYSATNAWIGTASNDSSTGNYHLTEYKTNGRGWVERVEDATGTITRKVFDGLGRVLSTWVGTDDEPTSGFWSPTNTAGTDLVKLATYEYDDGLAGDGNLTKLIQHVDSTSGNDRVTLYDYDWRNRLMLTRSGVTFSGSGGTYATPIEYLYTTYDNLDRPVTQERFHGSTGLTSWSYSNGAPASPASADRTHKNTTSFDDRGRVWKQSTFSVNTTTGAVSGDSLDTLNWFDPRGPLIKNESPGGLVTKNGLDGAGRQATTYFTDGGGDSAYADADDVAGDTVVEERHNQYDDASNVILVTSKLRFHDASGTGALGDASSGVKARVSHNAFYHDDVNRLVAEVNVGTNGGSSYIRPGSIPSRSDTVLVTSYTHDSAGNLFSTTDPRGIESRNYFDDLGRRTKLVEAYVDGTPSDADDRTTLWTHDGNGNTLSMTADLPSGQTDQTTSYDYEARTGRGDAINSNSVLIGTTYPDVGGGVENSESYTTNRAGQRTSWTDRNGTTHTYTHDLLGRLILDDVTVLGTGVDGTVRKLETSYNDQGLPHLLTSKSSGGTILNQIERLYNGLGQLTEEFQEHDGAVDAFTLSVQYAYSEMASGANHSRLIGMTYPNGRVLAYGYDSGLDSTISRLSKLTWDSTDVESHEYLGLSTVVERDRPEADHTLTYVKQGAEGNGDAGDQYTGLDRFGRIVDQRWGGMRNVIVGEVEEWQWVDIDRYQYGHDRNGNRLYEENLLESSLSELYHDGGGYDSLNRLGEFSRGTLNGTKDGLTGSASRSQEWSLDALGNWDSFTVDGGTAQTRTHDIQNRIATVSGATSPVHSANGEMTTDETGQTLKYDAWGRIVEVNTDGTGAVEITYAYDALNRRIARNSNDLFYTAQWQQIEERDAQGVEAQFVWSPVYIDAMVLKGRDSDSDGVMEATDERLYVIHDANFNVTAILDDAGTVVERYIYEPYGTRSVLDANWASDSDGISDYGFEHGHQGGRHDLDAGLVHFRFRWLDTSLGRWTRQDPAGYSDSKNLYLAFNSSPVAMIDPAGLHSGDQTGPTTGPTTRPATGPTTRPRLGGVTGLLGLGRGRQSLESARDVLKKACERGCVGEGTSCTVAECKAEADKIVDALLQAWDDYYGFGPHRDGRGSPSVGGYMCWDWAQIFEQAIDSLNPKCFTTELGLATKRNARPDAADRVPVHLWVKVFACDQRNDECKTSIDDGYLRDGVMVHPSPFPPAPGPFNPWEETTIDGWPIPPVPPKPER